MAFQSGQSGNPGGRPRGALSKRTQLAKLLQPYAEPLIAKAVGLALAGDVNALRICIERLIPKMQCEPLCFNVPDDYSQENSLKLKNKILHAALSGQISVGDAEKLIQLITDQSKNTSPSIAILTTNDPIEAAKIHKCVFRSKRTFIPVCKRTLISETSGHLFWFMRTPYHELTAALSVKHH
jgi:hypothetical protein